MLWFVRSETANIIRFDHRQWTSRSETIPIKQLIVKLVGCTVFRVHRIAVFATFVWRISIIIVHGVRRKTSFELKKKRSGNGNDLFSVNNCVGLLNYRYFFNFIISCSLLCFFGLAGSAVAAYLRWDVYKNDVGLFIAYNVPSFFIGVVAILLIMMLTPFSCYHCSLACEGVSTREKVRGSNDHLFHTDRFVAFA